MTPADELEKYLKDTPRDEVLKDWESTSHLDDIGIPVPDFH